MASLAALAHAEKHRITIPTASSDPQARLELIESLIHLLEHSPEWSEWIADPRMELTSEAKKKRATFHFRSSSGAIGGGIFINASNKERIEIDFEIKSNSDGPAAEMKEEFIKMIKSSHLDFQVQRINPELAV